MDGESGEDQNEVMGLTLEMDAIGAATHPDREMLNPAWTCSLEFKGCIYWDLLLDLCRFRIATMDVIA